MQRSMEPVALSALVVGALAWLFATEQGAYVRRQFTKHGQLMREQGERTCAQISRQVQGSAQDLLGHGRRLVYHVTRELA